MLQYDHITQKGLTRSLKKVHWILKTTFLILVLSPLMYMLSCADEEGEFYTFLEKNNGTEWLLNNDSLLVYIRINNNNDNLIEQWYYISKMDCFDYNSNIFSSGDCVIKENSTDRCVIAGDMVLSDYEYMTITRQDNLLRVDFTINEWQNETVFFSRSIEKVDNLNNCEPAQKIGCLFYKVCP